MNEIGIVKLENMGALPFFSVHYKGHRLNRISNKHCSETQGNCFDLVNKYLKIRWNNGYNT